jgi:hypothetical protein
VSDRVADLYPHLVYPAVLDRVQLVLRPGQPCPALDDALAQRGLDHAAYLTAYGPEGAPASAARDEPRQEALRAALRGRFEWIEAPGGWFEGAPDPKGEREPSLLVLGIGPDEAAALGQHFQQRAIVTHVRGGASTLVPLSP